MDDTHTRPERFTELQLAKLRRATVLKDPCFFCINRGDHFWDRTYCKVDGRTYLTCKSGRSQPAFEPDQERIDAI